MERKNKPKNQLNYSFTKEFIDHFDISSNDDSSDQNEKIDYLAQSHAGLGDFEKMQEKILGEVSFTILEKKILKNKETISKMKALVSSRDIINYKDSLQDTIENVDNNENYLRIKKIPKITFEVFNEMKNNLINEKYMEELKNFIINFKCILNSNSNKVTIGSLAPLTKLIENSFSNDKNFQDIMIEKYKQYSKYIFNYRSIKGDGNCYYRAVIFRYIEIIILEEKIDLFKNVIYDMKKCFYSVEITSRKNIKMNTVFKPELPLKIMLLIFDLLEKNKDVKTAYLIFVKSILICPIFDFGLIFYLRYSFYEYIKNNENKLYLKNFPIKIGNLLPSKYETESGEFLFKDFYENYLLKMFMDAEKIIIYLTPFILGINLNIILYEDENSDIIKKFGEDGEDLDKEKENIFENVIFLMNRKNHYELLYTKKENEKYQYIFCDYINNIFNKHSLIFSAANKEVVKKGKITKKNATDINFWQKHSNDTKKTEENNQKVITKKKVEKNGSEIKKNKKCKKNISQLCPTSPYEINNNMNCSVNTINNYPSYSDKGLLYNSMVNNIDYDDNNNNINNQNLMIVKTNSDNLNEKNLYLKNSHKNKIINNNIVENESNNNKLNLSSSKKISSNKYKNNKKKVYESEENRDSPETGKSIGVNISFSNKYSVKHLRDEKDNIYENNSSSTINKKLIFKNEISGDRKYSSKLNKTSEIMDHNTITEKELLTFRKNKTKVVKNKDRVKRIVINREKCTKCQVKYSINSKNKPLFNVCGKCLSNEIEPIIYTNYLAYISNMLNNDFVNCELIKEKFDKFLKENITVFEKDITIKDCLKETNKYSKEKNKDNEYYTLNNTILNIKKKICLVCLNEIKEISENLKIFCGCCFCSKEHLRFYFDQVNDIPTDSNFVCLCGYEYDNKGIYDLGIFFGQLGIWNLRKKIINKFNYMLKLKCCICEGNNQLVKIEYKDEINPENKDSEKILGGFKELKHYVCKECNEWDKSKGNKISFQCNFCNKTHIYIIKNM